MTGPVETELAKLVGQRAWRPCIGHGSFLTIEFGSPLEPNLTGTVHGEWHLWVRCCYWRLSKGAKILAHSEDGRATMSVATQQLGGHVLSAVEVRSPFHDVDFYFEGELMLSLFSYAGDDQDGTIHWELFTPSKQVMCCGPGAQVSVVDE